MAARFETRLSRVEEATRGVAPPPAFLRIVAPDVMDDAAFAAWQASALANLPADARVIVRRIVAPPPVLDDAA